MSAVDNGGPAFPAAVTLTQGNKLVVTPEAYRGLTLRDYFAAKALAALIGKADKDGANCGPKAVPKLAHFAYEYADAMLKERAK